MIYFFKKENAKFYIPIISLAVFVILSFFDKGLSIALIFVSFLIFTFLLIMNKIKIKDRQIYIIFLIAFFIHFLAVLFIYYTGFRPFTGGADFDTYQKVATELCQRFSLGNFSFDGLRINHYYPVFLAVIYMFTTPQILVGQFLGAFLAAIAILFVYFLVIECGGSKKSAFITTIVSSFYPSYLYFGSLTLKDTFVVPITVISIFLSIKIIKKLSFYNFIIFYFLLIILINLRFYIGFPVVIVFLICWFLISELEFKKRFFLGFLFFIVLGFTTQFSGYGYYAVKPIFHYLRPETIVSYREDMYVNEPQKPLAPKETPVDNNSNNLLNILHGKKNDNPGSGSTFLVSPGFENPFKFTINYSEIFIYAFSGPFPWQIKYRNQLFALVETIHLLILFFLILRGIFIFIKKNGFFVFSNQYKFILPLLLYVIISVAGFSLIISNFGLLMRIRMPSIIIFLCLSFFAFEHGIKINFKKIKNKKI